MSAGAACRNPEHRASWGVTIYKANYSAFNGYQYTPSDYSEVQCFAEVGACWPNESSMQNTIWRTKAAYVDDLPLGRPFASKTQSDGAND